MSDIDFPIFDLPFFLAKNKNTSWSERHVEMFICLVEFLQENQLLNKSPFQSQPIKGHEKIMRSDLTPLGEKVVFEALDKWLNGHDRGKPINDMRSFETTLAKYSKDN